MLSIVLSPTERVGQRISEQPFSRCHSQRVREAPSVSERTLDAVECGLQWRTRYGIGLAALIMPGKRVNPRRLSVSDAGKKILKQKRRHEKRGVPAQEIEPTTKGLWIVIVGAFTLFAIIAWIAARGGF